MEVFIKKLIKSDDDNNLSVGKLYNVRKVEYERVHLYRPLQRKYDKCFCRYMYLGEKNNTLYFKKAYSADFYTENKIIPIDFIDKILNKTLSIYDFDITVPLDKLIDVDIDKLNESLSEREYFIIKDLHGDIIPFKDVCVDVFNPEMFAGYGKRETICIINENDLTHPLYIKYGDIKFEDNYITLCKDIKPISIDDVKSDKVEIHPSHILIHKK
jgi:hypothetical protein